MSGSASSRSAVDAVPLSETSVSSPALGATKERDQRSQRDTRGAERPALSAKASQAARAKALRAQRQAQAKRAATLQKKAAQKKAAQRQVLAKHRAVAEQRKRAAAAKVRAKRQGYHAGSSPQTIARQIMQSRYGWGASQFSCYNKIIQRESGWKVHADNPSSSAYGIPQALPGSKMASAGPNWRHNPATQIKWGLGYVKSRYGTPCSAWSFKRSHGWY